MFGRWIKAGFQEDDDDPVTLSVRHDLTRNLGKDYGLKNTIPFRVNPTLISSSTNAGPSPNALSDKLIPELGDMITGAVSDFLPTCDGE